MKLKQSLICFCSLSVATISSTTLASEGSGSVGGGMNPRVSAISLLPRHLSIVADYDIPLKMVGGRPVVSTQKCFGVIPFTRCAVYADERRLEIEFNRDEFDFQKTGTVRKFTPKKGTLIGTPVWSDDGITDITMRNTTFETVTNFRWKSALKPVSVDTLWDGQRITIKEFNERLNKINAVLQNQLDFDQLETVADVVLFDRFLTLLTFESNTHETWRKLLVQVQERSSALSVEALRIVDESGRCDSVAFERFLREYSQWKTASAGWYKKLELLGASLYTFASAGVYDATKSRAHLSQLVTDSVLPYCWRALPSDLENKLKLILE